MYKIIGADGQEYGPISKEQVSQWIADGRLNRQSVAQKNDAPGWKPLAEFPEFAQAFSTIIAAGTTSRPGFASSDSLVAPNTGLAITSLVLGICSVTCLSIFAGIPAIITGHMAHHRARRAPAEFGGTGFAIAGFVLGYCSLLATIGFLSMFIPTLSPALSAAKDRAESINCMNNMKQIGLAARIWSGDNKDKYPFNVSTNNGGTLEFCGPGSDGFDTNAAMHLLVMSNELSNPRILVCPSDHSKTAGYSFPALRQWNISYLLRTGTNIDESNPTQVLAVCPIHGHVLLCDGSVQQGKKKK
jgi:hypothetical protein